VSVNLTSYSGASFADDLEYLGLTPDQAAITLGVHPITIWRWMHSRWGVAKVELAMQALKEGRAPIRDAKAHRLACGLKQAEMAAALRMETNSYQRWEYDPESLTTVQQLALSTVQRGQSCK